MHFVVGIGASAGGVEALCALLSEFKHGGSAFVVVTHLAPDRESLLAEVLARCTSMQVQRAQHGDRLRIDCVHVAPERYDILLATPSTLALVAPRASRTRATIDHFFASLAHHRGPHSVGIVLSGANDDGTAGLAAIRARGGATYAQDPATAQFERMPRSAAVHADQIGSPRQLGKLLMQHLQQDEAMTR